MQGEIPPTRKRKLNKMEQSSLKNNFLSKANPSISEINNKEQLQLDRFIDSELNLRSTNKQTASDIQFANVYTTHFGEFINESAPSNLSKLLGKDETKKENSSINFWDNIKVRPNTAYLKIDSLHQVTPPNHQPITTNGEPVYISLLIPSKVSEITNSNDSASTNDSPPPIIEIFTQLMDVTELKNQLELPSSSSTYQII